MSIFLLLCLLACSICGAFGAYVATQRGRHQAEGFVFGFVLGPIGVLVEVLLPERKHVDELEADDEFSSAWLASSNPKSEPTSKSLAIDVEAIAKMDWPDLKRTD